MRKKVQVYFLDIDPNSRNETKISEQNLEFWSEFIFLENRKGNKHRGKEKRNSPSDRFLIQVKSGFFKRRDILLFVCLSVCLFFGCLSLSYSVYFVVIICLWMLFTMGVGCFVVVFWFWQFFLYLSVGLLINYEFAVWIFLKHTQSKSFLIVQYSF